MNEVGKLVFKFDFLNPDFKTDIGYPIKFAVPAEFKFFLIHKLIDWLNQVNESSNANFNFKTLSVDDIALRGRNYFSINIYAPDGAGTIYIHYDEDNQFTQASVVFNNDVYRNQVKYPEHNHLFRLTITVDNKMEIGSYRLTRNIYSNDCNNDFDLYLHYDFDRNGVKLKDILILNVSVLDPELLKVTKENVDNFYAFDNFFNTIIDTIILSPNTFIELTSQFSIKKINNSESLAIFYDELRELYEKDLIVNLENNLEVIRMATI